MLLCRAIRECIKLSKSMADMLAELQRIEAGNNVSDDLLNIIELIAVTMYGLKGDAADDE